MTAAASAKPATAETVNGLQNDRLGGAINSTNNQEDLPKQVTAGVRWRDHLVVHPAAELFPLMAEAELKELADDIKQHGVLEPITLFSTDGRPALLDGRNRLDACALAGLLSLDGDGNLQITTNGRAARLHYWLEHQDRDPYALVLSYNAHRRHLTGDQKRELIAKVLKAQPEKSNRAIAKQTKADDKTVGKVRADLEANAEIPHKTERAEASGRKARGRKPATKQPKTEKHKPAPKVPGLQTDTGPTVDQQRAADLKQVFSDAVHILLGLASRLPSAQLTDIVPPSGLVMVANFLNQIAALKPDDAAASAEAMKAKHAAADPALIPDDLSIPPYLRRTAEATS
jgi:ParB-like nuclease domain